MKLGGVILWRVAVRRGVRGGAENGFVILGLQGGAWRCFVNVGEGGGRGEAMWRDIEGGVRPCHEGGCAWLRRVLSAVVWWRSGVAWLVSLGGNAWRVVVSSREGVEGVVVRGVM
jgi:hypothetical protein